MKIDDYLQVPNERRAMVRCQMDAQTPVGPFHNEYVWFFTFTEDGTKVTEITEFFDRKAAEDIVAKLKESGHLS